MNKKIIAICLMAATMLCYSFSCNKDNDTPPDNNGNNNNNGNPATTLPVSCNFSGASIPFATSAMVGGVSFSYTGQNNGTVFYPGTVGYDSVKTCLPAGTDAFGTNGSSNYPGINISGVLIADVSNLPAINKVTVKLFRNAYITVNLCDGNGVVAEAKDGDGSGTNPEVTYTLNVGNKKGSKLYIYSREAIIYSIAIE